MEFDKREIARIIKNKRKEAGLKQSELAEKIGISEKHLSKIETGKNFPALDNFLKIIKVLDLSLADFGIKNNEKINSKRNYLKNIINSLSEKQLDVYLDVINALHLHI